MHQSITRKFEIIKVFDKSLERTFKEFTIRTDEYKVLHITQTGDTNSYITIGSKSNLSFNNNITNYILSKDICNKTKVVHLMKKGNSLEKIINILIKKNKLK